MQTSHAAGSVPSAPGREGQMLLELPLSPNQHPLTDVTASILDGSAAGASTVQQSNQPVNHHGDIAMPHWSSTDMNDIIPSEASPWEILRDAPGDLDLMSWLTGPDFDLDALNQSLIETTENQTTNLIRNSNEVQVPIQRRWHTFPEPILSSGQTTPDLRCPNSSDRDQGHIHMIADESYRQKLAEGLQQRIQTGILPSTGFLVSVYFSTSTITQFSSLAVLVGLLPSSILQTFPVHISTDSCANISSIEKKCHCSLVDLFHW